MLSDRPEISRKDKAAEIENRSVVPWAEAETRIDCRQISFWGDRNVAKLD